MKTYRVPVLALLPALLLLALPPSAAAAAAAPAANPGSAAYQEGYRAALAAARKALAAGQSLDSLSVPAAPAASDTAASPVGDPGVGRMNPDAMPPASAGGKSSEPPDWWNHSSLRYPLQDSAWRHGLQVNLSGASLSGNDSGSAWRGGGKFNSRLGRWTNELSGTIDKRSISPANGGPPNRRDYRMLQDSLRYDLSERAYLSGGLILERDDVALVDSRLTALAGAGYYWVDTEQLRFNTFLGLGQLQERYMAYVRDHVGINQRDAALAYFYQTLEWRFAPQWRLRQGFRLMQDLDRSGHYVLDRLTSTPPSAANPAGFERYSADRWVHRYRTVTAVDLDYQLNPRSVVSLGVERRFDSNPWPDVVRADVVRRLTLNISF